MSKSPVVDFHFLRRFTQNGIYNSLLDADCESKLKLFCEQRNMSFHRIDLSRINGHLELMDVFAAELDFPGYFGRNFDALYDCLTDRVTIYNPDGCVLILNGCNEFSAKNEHRDITLLLEVLAASSDDWEQDKIPFFVILKSEIGLAECNDDLRSVTFSGS